MRAVLVCTGAWGFEKDAGLVISETTCGRCTSAGNRIASNDCIKSIAAPEHPKVGARVEGSRTQVNF